MTDGAVSMLSDGPGRSKQINDALDCAVCFPEEFQSLSDPVHIPTPDISNLLLITFLHLRFFFLERGASGRSWATNFHL